MWVKFQINAEIVLTTNGATENSIRKTFNQSLSAIDRFNDHCRTILWKSTCKTFLKKLTTLPKKPSFPFIGEGLDICDWISPEEEDKTAPSRDLEEWTGIRQEQLPPPEMLSDDQLAQLLQALKKMLDAYNCSFVLQTVVPDRIQYAAIRDNLPQRVKVRQWHMGFFELCHPDTEHRKCALGEHCQCEFYEHLFSRFKEDDYT